MSAQDSYSPLPDPSAVVQSGNMRFTVLTPQMIRIQYSASQQFEDRATFAIVNRRLDVPEFTTEESGGYLYIRTSALELRYKLGSKPSVNDHSSAKLGVWFTLNGQTICWYPGKDNALNLKGTKRTVDNLWGDSQRADLEDGLLSREGWSVIDESPLSKRGDGSTTFAFEPNSDGFQWWAQPVDKNAIDWYFMGYGHDYKQALYDYTRVAGRVPLPPKYVFGYWYSRYWAYTQNEMQQIVREVERYDIPMDVLIVDTDWHINGWTGWSWNKSLFPTPKSFITYVHNHGLKTSLNLHPAFGVDSNEDNYSLLRKDMGLSSSYRDNIPWQLHDYTFYKSMFDNIIRLREEEGVDFWWLDWQQWLTSKYVDNLSETFWCNHVFFEDMRLRRPDVRPVIFHRWGGLGSHRYQIGFSGDSWTSWSTLGYQIPFTSTASNVCYDYWGHDLGGHQGGNNDPELFLRWMQFGVFTPIFRSHATNDSKIERRIWKFSNFEQLLETVRLRYTLFPYIYTAARQTYDCGLGINRPLYYEYPEDQNAYKFEDEYFFGDNMLVAPIYTPAEKDGRAWRRIWLPEGQWWDVPNNCMVSGNRVFNGWYTPEEIPLYYKAGSIIPMYPVQRTVQSVPQTIILQVVPGSEGEGRLYEDQGDSQDYMANGYSVTHFSQHSAADVTTVTISPREGNYQGMPTERTWMLQFLGVTSRPTGVTVDNKPCDFNFDSNTQILTVSVPDNSFQGCTVRVMGKDGSNDLALNY